MKETIKPPPAASRQPQRNRARARFFAPERQPAFFAVARVQPVAENLLNLSHCLVQQRKLDEAPGGAGWRRQRTTNMPNFTVCWVPAKHSPLRSSVRGTTRMCPASTTVDKIRAGIEREFERE